MLMLYHRCVLASVLLCPLQAHKGVMEKLLHLGSYEQEPHQGML